MDAKNLLLADMEHFGESLWRNEDVGEKRFNFFVTLVTAVLAGLVALATSQNEPAKQMLDPVAGWAMGVLLLFGLLSYLRMIHRNRVTHQYHETLRYIRDTYLAACPNELNSYRVPRRVDELRGKWLKAGYAETIGTIDGLLFAGVLWRVGVAPYLAGILGAGVATALWLYARRRGV